MTDRTKALDNGVKSIDTSRRAINHWVSKDVLDRDSELVKAEGCNPAEFMANPVVLWSHDRKMLPIGRCGDGSLIKVIGEGVEAWTEFASTPFASDVWDLYQGGFLKAWSAGFTVAKADGPELDGQQGCTISEWNLREYSACTIPVNPAALVKAAEAGSDLAGRLLQLYHPEEKDAVGAARVAVDVRRVLTGLESLANWQRHCKAEGREFDTEPLAKAAEFLISLGIVPALPAAPQPHVDATDGDLPDEAVAELLTLVKTMRDNLRRKADRDELARQARRALIGGGYPR